MPDDTTSVASTPWQPSLGAWPAAEGGTLFRVWAPEVDRVELVVDGRDRPVALTRAADGTYTTRCDDVSAGARYRYRLDGRGPFPDPASRAQPDGVHGPSEVVDPAFGWTDGGWGGVAMRDLVVYELHVGTFTTAGTFAAAIERLPLLVDLGVTAVELLPVADFAGDRNWGYDGVALFAPARVYGPPHDLRRLVDRAHALGLAVLLDVVYNHLGPDGAYHGEFSPYYYSTRHQSPWGAAINYDGPQAHGTRAFVIENALCWLHEYHLDGLRLDATHAIVDESPVHVIAELTARVRASTWPEALLVVEDGRNLAATITPAPDGWGTDGVWADDLHHQLRRATAGDDDGYFADYTGTVADTATTIDRGWFYCGAHSAYLDEPRGTDPTGLPLERFVVCLQNHDQVGNRAFGDRLHAVVDPAVHRALAALLCCLPETPLLFMGEEWAASTPFRYFTDHHETLGRLVTEGRRQEFGRFRAFADPDARARIPDPQALATFEACRLDWRERDDPPHAGVLRLYTALLGLRRTEPALRAPVPSGARVATPLGPSTLRVTRTAPGGERLLVVCHLRGAASVTLDTGAAPPGAVATALTTEEPRFVARPAPPVVADGPPLTLRFARPGAVVLRVGAAA